MVPVGSTLSHCLILAFRVSYNLQPFMIISQYFVRLHPIPFSYGRVVRSGGHRLCEYDVVSDLRGRAGYQTAG